MIELIGISLWQPWASAIAVGMKTIETRSWPDFHSIGKRLAIHAAKRKVRQNDGLPFWVTDKIHSMLNTPGFPYGAFVATAFLKDCVPTDKVFSRYPSRGVHNEILLGNYDAGRYAWVLSDVRPLLAPVPALGYQRLWTVQPDITIQIKKAGGL